MEGDDPKTPPPGFAGPRPPLPPGGSATPPPPPAVAQPLPPAADRASTRAIARRSNRSVIFWAVAVLALIGAGVGLKALTTKQAKVTEPTKTFTTVPPTSDRTNDPAFHAFVRDYCGTTDRSQAARATAYRPGATAYTSVFFSQAIGAPGQRTGWFMVQVSPRVGAPETEASFSGVPSSRLQLATCATRRLEEPTGINCTYPGDASIGLGDQVVELVRTRYDITVFEVKTHRTVATGVAYTDGRTCPTDAQVDGGDTVSGPMTASILTDWFSQHFTAGVPS